MSQNSPMPLRHLCDTIMQDPRSRPIRSELAAAYRLQLPHEEADEQISASAEAVDFVSSLAVKDELKIPVPGLWLERTSQAESRVIQGGCLAIPGAGTQVSMYMANRAADILILLGPISVDVTRPPVQTAGWIRSTGEPIAEIERLSDGSLIVIDDLEQQLAHQVMPDPTSARSTWFYLRAMFALAWSDLAMALLLLKRKSIALPSDTSHWRGRWRYPLIRVNTADRPR